ncbi:hypothetical protein EVAR_19399_1 [Eumeta japonica]|uniref:Uncharacterized protein n=1 Tax=Eumeta variegata TaxID=151549 RepID=A0A4C1TRR2_EUMVA|nr:hypothetical protein EVAR_19399_1 [Eumeta japonica]
MDSANRIRECPEIKKAGLKMSDPRQHRIIEDFFYSRGYTMDSRGLEIDAGLPRTPNVQNCMVSFLFTCRGLGISSSQRAIGECIGVYGNTRIFWLQKLEGVKKKLVI